VKPLVAALSLCCFAALAVADNDVAITLEVGETVTTEVGMAMGHRCDDNEKVVHGEMRTRDPTTNMFVVTGLEVGTTRCRVGLVEGARPSYLFEITVTPPAETQPERS
jgi:hypothetical protein